MDALRNRISELLDLPPEEFKDAVETLLVEITEEELAEEKRWVNLVTNQ